MLINRIFLFFFILFCVTISHAQKNSEWDWYAYYYNGKLIGHAQSIYEHEKSSNLYSRKRIKVINVPQKETEEISLVLNSDYTVRSLYLTTSIEGHNKLLVVTVGSEITLQTVDKIYTFPLKYFYFQIEDFLRSLVSKRLEQGKFYKSTILATNHMKLLHATARYLGKKNILHEGTNIDVHEFAATSEELGNEWGKAYVSVDGKLIHYGIGNFFVSKTNKKEIVHLSQNSPVVRVPYLCDFEAIDRIYMTGELPVIQDNYYQKSLAESIIIRRVQQKNDFVLSTNIKKQYQTFLKSENFFPVDSSVAREVATIAKHGATNPGQVVENINSWLHIHLSSSESKYGITLQQLFGVKKDILSIATVTLCRTQEIPSRLVSGFLLSSGAFIFTSWCEVFLGEWIPVYDGKLGLARFVKTSDGIVEDYKPFHNIEFSFTNIVKNNKEILFDKMSNILSVQENYFSDQLLGISGMRPADWAFLPKNIFSNMIVFRSLKGTGPAILVKVAHSNQKIEEALASLLQATTNEKTTLLWQNERKFNNIQGIEGALEVNNFIYQAFIGTKNDKMVFALLFVPKHEFKNVQEQFFHFLSSLKFT